MTKDAQKWEVVAKGAARLAVPGGWLYLVTPYHEGAGPAVAFVPAPAMWSVLDEAEAGLEFALASIQRLGGCNCSRADGAVSAGFVCSPHKALASVRAAIAKPAPVSESPEVR